MEKAERWLFEVDAVAGVVVKRVKGVKKLVAQPMRQAQGRGSRQVRASARSLWTSAAAQQLPLLLLLSALKRMYKRRQRGRDNDSEVGEDER